MATAGEALTRVLSEENFTAADALTNFVDGIRALFNGDIAGLVEGAFFLIPIAMVFLVVFFLIRFALETTLMKHSDHRVYSKGISWGIALGAVFQPNIFKFIWNFMSNSFVFLIAFILVVFVLITLLSRMNKSRLEARTDESNAAAAKWQASGNNLDAKAAYANKFAGHFGGAAKNLSKFSLKSKKEAEKVQEDEAQEDSIDQTVDKDQQTEQQTQTQADKDAQSIASLLKRFNEVAARAKAGDAQAAQEADSIRSQIAQLDADAAKNLQIESNAVAQEEAAEKQEEKVVKDEMGHLKKELRDKAKEAKLTADPNIRAKIMSEANNLKKVMADLKLELDDIKLEEDLDEKQKKYLAHSIAALKNLSKHVQDADFMSDPIKYAERLNMTFSTIDRIRAKLDDNMVKKLHDHQSYKSARQQAHSLITLVNNNSQR